MAVPALLYARKSAPAYKTVETTTTGKTIAAPEMGEPGYGFRFTKIDRSLYALFTRIIFHANN